MIITERTLHAILRQHPDYAARLFVAEVAHDSYDRFILVPHAYHEVLPVLNQALAKLAADNDWRQQLKLDQ